MSETARAWLGGSQASSVYSGHNPRRLSLIQIAQNSLINVKLAYENHLSQFFANEDKDFFKNGIMTIKMTTNN